MRKTHNSALSQIVQGDAVAQSVYTIKLAVFEGLKKKALKIGGGKKTWFGKVLFE
jgi:hypothetical protein